MTARPAQKRGRAGSSLVESPCGEEAHAPVGEAGTVQAFAPPIMQSRVIMLVAGRLFAELCSANGSVIRISP